jgi:hypothetical protein
VAAAGTDGGTSAPGPSGPTTPAPSAVAGALAVTPSTIVEHQVAVVTGSVSAGGAGHPLWLQAREGQGAWDTVLAGTANAAGEFALSWHASRSGQLSLRVVSSTTASASSVTSTPEVALTVYRQIVATWYGPGFYGNRTACGERLTKSIVGLADRTLPCGTPVSLTYNGITLTIPVIDRGPYANDATIDLTHAAAQELGIKQTVDVDMLALSGPPLAPTNWFAPTTSGSGATGATGAGGTSFAGGATAPNA